MKALLPFMVAASVVGIGACGNADIAFKALKCRAPGAKGCAKTTPIPQDQEALMHWFWANYTTATDAEIHEAVTHMHNAIHADTLSQALEGTMDPLGSSDLASVDTTTTDPSPALGLLIADAMDCSVDNAERITTSSNQMDLYPGVYESYTRTYESSLEDYLARRNRDVRWAVASSGSLLGSKYSMRYGGGDRFVPAQEGSAAVGPILLNRSWLKEPAHFDTDTRAIPQDYQIEVYYERAPGKVIHLWGDWREVRVGTLTDNDQVVLEILLGNMNDWDTQTRSLCSQNKPPPP